jgi:hypothetical protein
MKKFLLGILFTLTLSTTNHYALSYDHKTKLHDAASFLEYQVFQGGYLLNPIMGNCADEEGENGFGWKFNVADYYRCDKFQRLLNGNHKPYNPKSSSI